MESGEQNGISAEYNSLGAKWENAGCPRWDPDVH